MIREALTRLAAPSLRRHDRLRFVKEAEKRATRISRYSYSHGPDHWRDVAAIGLRLLDSGVPADPDVLLAFAALHDTQRRSERSDPDHGPRAGDVALELREDGFLDWLDEEQFVGVLLYALDIHTEARPGPGLDVRLGACFDADRLTLWRVGTVPKEEYLSTPEAVELIGPAFGQVAGPDGSWRDLVTEYEWYSRAGNSRTLPLESSSIATR